MSRRQFALPDRASSEPPDDTGCTILHVDTNNPTPALSLYQGVGIRTVLVIDVWRRVMPSTDQ